MFSSLRRFVLPSFIPALLLAGAVRLSAQSAEAVAKTARIAGLVDSAQTVRLSGHRPDWATQASDQGALSQGTQLTNLHLVLSRAPAVEAAFQQLLLDQQNPASPRYHQWLTPQQNAERYGVAPADLAAVSGWLRSEGLQVEKVTSGGVFVTFSGPASAVGTAFSTALHTYLHNGKAQYAPASEPGVPAAFAGVVQSVVGLSAVERHVHSHVQPVDGGVYRLPADEKRPSATFSGGTHLLTPGDFNLIYDINAAQSAGYNGAGYRVVVLIDSAVVASDISSYETLFGLSAGQPTTIVVPGTTSPGVSADEGEADLDVERVIGTAPGAGVDLLVLPGLYDKDIFNGLQYEISTLNDPVVNMSFGGCNTDSSGPAEAAQYSSLYQMAVAQGITLFNSSGDSGAAGCESGGATPPKTTQVLATNILCMSQYITCVGGTEFADTASPSSYWSSTNSATGVSALGYIPEGAWNEPTQTSSSGAVSYVISGTGGGSGYLAKPTWQTGTGVPADGLRDMPDVSFSASDHNGYLVCQADIGNNCAAGSFKYVIGGTSASSPSMAAIAAMLDQKLGGRQGNINPLLYQLAAGSSSPFHDATVAASGVTSCAANTPSMCNNSTPGPTSLTGGLSGYLLTTGYDEATGLGSLDVNNLLTAATTGTTGTFTVVPASTTLNLLNTAGGTATDVLTLTSVNKFAGAVTLSCQVTGSTGTAAGTCALSPTSATLSASGTATSTLTVTNTTAANAGTLTVTVTGTSGSTAVTSSAITATVSGATFTIKPESAAPTLFSSNGGSITDALTVSSANGFSGTVALTCKVATASGTAAGTCTLSSPSVAVTSTAAGSSILTVNSSTVGASGALTVTVTGTSGSITASAVINTTVTAPSFGLTPTATSLSTTSGTPVSTTVTVAATGNFTGSVALSCSLSTSSAAFQPTCSIAPTPVTVGSTGTVAAALTIASTTARTSALKQPLSAAASRRRLEGGAVLAMLLFCAPLRKRRKGLGSVAVVTLLGLGLGTLSGCSDKSSVTAPTTKSSAGTYTVTIQGSGTTAGASAASTATATVTVTIN